MSKYRIFLFTVLLLIPLWGLSAEEALVLDVAGCIQAAMEQNRSLLMTGIDRETAGRDYENRWNLLFPGIDASTGLKQSDELFSDTGTGSDTLSFSASLSVSLPLNRALAYQIKQTGIDYEASRIDYETARKQLVQSVEKEFYYLLATKSNLDLLEKNQELAQKRYEQTQENFRNGFASELEVLQSQVSAASYKPELSQARSDYSARQRSFLILLGMEPDRDVQLEGRLEADFLTLNYEQLIKGYLASRQDIRGQQNLIDSLENSRKTVQASGFSPSFTLSGGWNTAVMDPLEGESWESDSWSDTASVGVTLTIPLDGYIPGSSQKTALEEADDQITRAALTLADLEDSAKVEILNLIESLSTTQEILEQAALNAELALKSFEMTEKSYNLGTAERLDVEDAQQAYLSAKQQYLTGQYNYLAGLIDMKYALNLEETKNLYEINGKGERNHD